MQFVCMGGTPQRMKTFAYYVAEEINVGLPDGGELEDLTALGQRYSMYKIGPVLSVSVSICLVEEEMFFLSYQLFELDWNQRNFSIKTIFLRIKSRFLFQL